MTTAAKVATALADSLGKTVSSVEAYCLALRAKAWWEPTKRGRAARPLTTMDGAKLLLAILSEGPQALPQFFLRYANMALSPNLRDTPLTVAVREILGVKRDAQFLDYIEALVRLYRDGRAHELIYYSPDPPGFLPESAYDGPGVEIRIKGPYPLASIRFLLSHKLIDRLEAEGVDSDSLLGRQTLPFLDQLYGWAQDATERGDDPEPYYSAAGVLRDELARGVGFERFIGGREVSALSAAFSSDQLE